MREPIIFNEIDSQPFIAFSEWYKMRPSWQVVEIDVFCLFGICFSALPFIIIYTGKFDRLEWLWLFSSHSLPQTIAVAASFPIATASLFEGRRCVCGCFLLDVRLVGLPFAFLCVMRWTTWTPHWPRGRTQHNPRGHHMDQMPARPVHLSKIYTASLSP